MFEDRKKLATKLNIEDKNVDFLKFCCCSEFLWACTAGVVSGACSMVGKATGLDAAPPSLQTRATSASSSRRSRLSTRRRGRPSKEGAGRQEGCCTWGLSRICGGYWRLM